MRPTLHRSDDRPPRDGVSGRSPIRAVVGLGVALTLGGLALLPGAAAANELPDGYGYEMVSPPFTQGQRAQAVVITDDGNRVLLASGGGFAGTPSLPDVSIQYLGERTPTGWEISPLAPSPSEYPYYGQHGMIDHTDDLSRSLWFANLKADENTFNFTPVVRDPDGSFHTAGVTQINEANDVPVGTSSDLLTVIQATKMRPPLADGTVDTRGANRKTLLATTRAPDGSLSMRQIAYRQGATMFPTCEVGLGGDGRSTRGAVSYDASTIFFTPLGLPSCKTVVTQRVWAKVGSADPFDVSAPTCTVDCGLPQRVLFEGASRDGSRVVFSTEQKLIDGDGDTTAMRDLYEYDFNAAGEKLLPVTSSPSPDGAGFVMLTRLSEDGSRAYFVANGRPLAGENNRGETPQPGEQNLYVYHREAGEPSGTTTFIAALDPADADLWSADVRRPVHTTPTGRFAIFASFGDLTGDRLPGDTHWDTFRYDSETDELRRIWVSDPEHNGAARTAGSFLGAHFGSGYDGGRQKNWRLANPITHDGSMISFETAEPLSPDDDNNVADAYLWQEETGRITMLTDGKSLVDSRAGYVTPSGDSMAITSASPLVKAHTGGSVAAFVVRKGGGFPDAPLPPLPCGGDACQGAQLPSPEALAAPGSQVLDGRGNAVVGRQGSAKRLRVARIKTVRGVSTRIRVRVPGKGRIRVSGRGLVRTSKASPRAATYRVAVKLSQRARAKLARVGSLQLPVVVRFTPEQGRHSQVRRVVTFKVKQSVRRATAPSSDSRKGR